MTYEQLKDYISILLDMEKNIYIQKKTLENLYNKRNTLGIKRNIDAPYNRKAELDIIEYMLRAGLICGAIGFIIGVFAKWSDAWSTSGIFAVIIAPLFGIFIALIVGLAGGIIIGPFVAIGVRNKEQAEYDSFYREKLKEYDHKKTNDDNRVKNELIKRRKIQQEINLLEAKYKESKKRLDEFYNYNIVNRKYHHEIVAIASFYQYLDEKRTYSLEFNPKTGDKGAYNIFSEESQRGIIISQLSQVLEKLDQVMENQYEIQNVLIDANKRIDSLKNNVSYLGNQVNSSIQEQTAIQAYNAERTQAEIRFMNAVNIMLNWH